MAPRRGSSKTAGVAGANKPLAGQVIFLDLRGFRDVHRLKSDVRSLGGRFGNFLDREITCVITDQKDKRAFSTGSPSDKSFWTRGKPVSKKGQHRTSRNNEKVDALATASALGIQIKHVKLVLEWIDNIKNEQMQKTSSSRSPGTRKTDPVTCKCKYACPQIDFITSVGTCPFDDTSTSRPMQTRAATQRMQTKCKGVTSKRTPISKSAPQSRQRSTKGFCDLCNISFKVIQSHVRTVQHQTFADYWRNFTRLVQHSVAGPDVNAFMRDLRKEGMMSNVPNTNNSALSTHHQHAESPVSRRTRNQTKSGTNTTSKTPVSSSSPIEWSPSPTPAKLRRSRKYNLWKRLKQVQRKLSFSGFDDEPIETKILARPRTRGVSRTRNSSKSSPRLTTLKKTRLRSSQGYTEILPSTRRGRNRAESPIMKEKPRSKRSRNTPNITKVRQSVISKSKKTTDFSKLQQRSGPAESSKNRGKLLEKVETPVSRRTRNQAKVRGKSASRTPVSSTSPIEWSPSPTPKRLRQAEKNELRKRMKQVQRRLSFSGFEYDRFESKILKGSRTRGLSNTPPKSTKSSPLLTTPRKRKLESRGSHTEILPSSRRPVRGGTRNGSPEEKPKTNRARHTSAVIKDLMTRLDDAKANRPDTPPPSLQVQNKKPIIKKRPRPRRTCGTYQQKRSRTGTVGPTVQQVARKLKKELAASTPVICTMSLRNGKMKFSES